jgi:hypothetical protein
MTVRPSNFTSRSSGLNCGSIAIGFAAGTTHFDIFATNYANGLTSLSFVFRENRVPFYQRLFQNHDGKRQWWKVSLTRNGHIRPQLDINKYLTLELFRRPPVPVTLCTPT